MIYPDLPAVGTVTAPNLEPGKTPNMGSRNGAQPAVLFNHVWGGGRFDGVISWLTNPESQASAHVVYAGETGPDAGKAMQLVPWADKAWTQCAFNAVGISIETADAVWAGHDPHGFARLARMTALVLHVHGWYPRWVKPAGLLAGTRGHTRHADAGAAGCGHLECPTADLALYQQFAERVTAEYRYGGFRSSYGH